MGSQPLLPLLRGFLQPRALQYQDSRFVCSDVPAATGSLGMKAHLQWPKGQDCRLCLCCVFQSTYFWIHRCMGLFGILVCWAEETLLSYGCFTGWRLKGRDKESISLHHDAFSITYSGAVNPDHSLSLPAFSTVMISPPQILGIK